MFLKDFLYFITDAAGMNYRVRNGLVEKTGVLSPLPVTPDGWQEKSIKYGRSAKYHGLVRSFSTPLKFVKQGAKILRDRLYKAGTEAELFLVIHRLDKTFLGSWKHLFFYKGELDLTKAEDGDSHFTCNIMEGGLSKLFKANENTVYEIPIDVPEARIVKMNGVTLKSKTTYTIIRSFAPQALSHKQIIPFQKTSTEGFFFNLILQDSIGDLIDLAENEITSDDLTVSEKHMFEANAPLTVIVSVAGGVIANSAGGSGQAGQEWFLETSLGQVVSLGTFAINFTDSATEFSLSGSITLVKGERVFLYRMSTPYQVHGNWSYTDLTQANIAANDRYKTTYIKALSLSYVFQQLLNKITGSTAYTFSSNYLTTDWDNLLITGFDAIRAIVSPKLKISFSSLYDSVNVPCNIEMDISGTTLSIEKKETAYGTAISCNLGEVKELTVKPATEQQYNTVKIGWPDLKTEDVNGRDEFNVSHVYTSPVTKVSNQLSLVSKVFASMYEIELTRINMDGRETTNNEVDNDSCFLHVEKQSAIPVDDEPTIYNFYRLLRETYDSITGIPDTANVFNIELSPKRCLLRHGNYLRSIFYGNEAGYLKFQSGDKNSDLKTVLGSVTIQENADVLIGTLAPAPLFLPFTFNCKSRVPKNIIDVMEANPNETFTFEWDGIFWYGFPVEVGIQPSSNAEQETVMLVSPINDLTKLIA